MSLDIAEPILSRHLPDAPAKAALEIDPELLEQFGGRGPRYTSYPSADRFHPALGASDFGQALEARRSRAQDPLGLYVHIPFCKTICYYCGCNKIGTKHASRSTPYLENLVREIDLVCERLGPRQRISHLHFGGGTPTFMPDEELSLLLDHLRVRFGFDPEGEYSIEVDPRTVDAARMKRLRGLGLNRVSLGVQDFDPAVQAAVNRIQPWEQTASLIEAGRKAGFVSINVDLIYGLPRQTAESFRDTIRRTVQLGPDRIALYHYAHLPQLFKPQRRIHEADLPSATVKGRMFEEAVRHFEAAGYQHLGLDHFAREDDELSVAQRDGRLHRNFQGYCSHDAGDIIGLGVSAISSVGGVYAQNDKVLTGWEAALALGDLPTVRGVRLDDDDQLRREMIQSLMCNFRLDATGLAARFGPAAQRCLDEARTRLEPLRAAGAIALGRSTLEVLPRGRLLVRAVAMAFDRYLVSQSDGSRYSRIA